MTACSACRTILPVGASHCPNCSAQITALAIPVVKRQMSTISFVLLCMLGFCIAAVLIGHVVDAIQDSKIQAAHAALIADLHSGRLSTPDSFQARCGAARSVHFEKNVVTLAYMNGDIRVKLAPGKPIDYYRAAAPVHLGGKSVEMPITEDFALEHLQCER